MRLASVHTYPVKSCHRVDHDSAAVPVEPWGLADDRRWMVVDGGGHCVTQREEPALARVHPLPRSGGGLILRSDGAPELPVAEPAPAEEPARVTVHRSTVTATPAGGEPDEWFSTLLGRPVRLVWLDDPTRRPVDPAYGGPDDRVSLADAYPLLATNTASLAALNDWVLSAGGGEEPVPMTRFRPNVVIDGAPAWAEDGWLGRRLRIGAVTFRVVKPCSRCVVTTTDQETGARGREPLRTLGRHRSVDQKLLFGVNLVPDPPYGGVSAGDPVTLLP